MKLLLLLVATLSITTFANEKEDEAPVFVNQADRPAPLNYTTYTQYFSRPEGTATLIRDGKVIRKGTFRGIGYEGGDTVHLSKGLHFIDVSQRATSVSEDMRIGFIGINGIASNKGPITIEGEGAETIVIESSFAKNKRAPQVIRMSTESDDDIYLKNMTFVNSEWDILRDRDDLFKTHFENIRFEGGFAHLKKRPIEECLFCVFDYQYDDMTLTGIKHIGSIYFNGKNYVEVKAASKATAYKSFVDKVLASRKNGSLVNGADAKSARDLYVALGESKVDSLESLSPRLRSYLAANYKFEIPKDSKIEGIIKRSRAQLNLGRPLLARVIAFNLPKDMDKNSDQDAKLLMREINVDLTKTYSLCSLSASTRKHESAVERANRGGRLPELINKKIGSAIESKYPILMMADPSVCKMEFNFVRNSIRGGVDDKDKTVAHDIVEDREAMYQAEQARNSAMFAGAASIGAMAKGMANANEQMWRREIDKSTHFQQHVGGTDLVSWKMDRSVKFNADGFAAKSAPIAHGFTKQVDRIVVNYRAYSDTDLQADAVITDRGKKSVTPLAHFKKVYVEESCQQKFEIDPSTGGPGPEVPPEFGQTNDCPKRLSPLKTDYALYTSMVIMPVVDSYVVQYVMPAFEKAAKRAIKSNSIEDRAEAALMSTLFKQELNDDQMKILKSATGIDGADQVLVASAKENFDKISAAESAASIGKIKEPPFPVRITCDYPVTIGYTVPTNSPCGHLYSPAGGKPIVLKTEGINQYTCDRNDTSAAISQAIVIYDPKLENAVIAAVNKMSPQTNKPQSVEDWNETFSEKLDLPFGYDTANPQYAYHKYLERSLISVVQLELKKVGGKMILGDAYCGVCNDETEYNKNPPSARWKHLLTACKRLVEP